MCLWVQGGDLIYRGPFRQQSSVWLAAAGGERARCSMPPALVWKTPPLLPACPSERPGDLQPALGALRS